MMADAVSVTMMALLFAAFPILCFILVQYHKVVGLSYLSHIPSQSVARITQILIAGRFVLLHIQR